MLYLIFHCSTVGFSVSRGGSCTGYRWDVRWLNKPGDQPDMELSGRDLEGVDVEISFETRTDGGLWIRPLRGDMMRLPETEPQVSMHVCILCCWMSNGMCL